MGNWEFRDEKKEEGGNGEEDILNITDQGTDYVEDNKDGAAMELYGDIYKQLKLTDIALKYWVKAKEFGGASDKIDQKIASEKND